MTKEGISNYARVGNADDIGDTWVCPVPSSDMACTCRTDIAGVCGAFAEVAVEGVATLLMNHDYERYE